MKNYGKIGGWGQGRRGFEWKTWDSEVFELTLVGVGLKQYFSEIKLQAECMLDKTRSRKTSEKAIEMVPTKGFGPLPSGGSRSGILRKQNRQLGN